MCVDIVGCVRVATVDVHVSDDVRVVACVCAALRFGLHFHSQGRTESNINPRESKQNPRESKQNHRESKQNPFRNRGPMCIFTVKGELNLK